MKAIRKFTVRNVLPESLKGLEELVFNLRWSWHQPTKDIFEYIANDSWDTLRRDAVDLLGSVTAERLDELADDQEFINRVNRQRDDLHDYLGADLWYQGLEGEKPAAIAYFSPEFGITAALPQYSGGLGILAGDHLKAASDLGVPLVGIGLFYRSGYFSQSISADGWQKESYPVLDPDGLPLTLLRSQDDIPVRIALALSDGRTLFARIWVAKVGRVSLLLLDTDIADNDQQLRGVTDRLYGGGSEHRLLQELLLGIGGMRALRRWVTVTGSTEPTVFHTNEGHAGFQGLERISALIGEGLSFHQALQIVRAGTVFTTHTPVAAGIDRFDRDLIRSYFTEELLPGVAAEDALGLGSEDYEGGDPAVFNMAVMGLRLAQRANGVSKLHGEVSREMFQGLWPGFDASEVPIGSITNGVHNPTWTHRSLAHLAARDLEAAGSEKAEWTSDAVSDTELWRVRGEMRSALVADARERVKAGYRAENPKGVPPQWYSELLDPEVLTIGFARRVPTYKRLTLMLTNKKRLKRILTNPEQPVQLVIAGKAHPADDGGKKLIQELVHFASDPEVRDRIVFLPNYDIGMAETLYPGTDVWLNNPLRPLEACGTSGMKAALNGSLNLSVLDGWWDEFYDGENGWAIPTADGAGDDHERDHLEAAALYDLIEHQIAPLFYERDRFGVPVAWLRKIRHTLSTLTSELSADRMVKQYVTALYVPASASAQLFDDDEHERARELSAWKQRVVAAWPGVAVKHVESGGLGDVAVVGDRLRVRAYVALGELAPSDVSVQVVYGRTVLDDDIEDVQVGLLEFDESGDAPDGDAVTFSGTIELESAGAFGYSVRVVPRHELLSAFTEMGLIAVPQH